MDINIIISSEHLSLQCLPIRQTEVQLKFSLCLHFLFHIKEIISLLVWNEMLIYICEQNALMVVLVNAY